MKADEIRRYICQGGDYYLTLLADADHMEHHDDGFCTWIHPKQGEQGGTSIYNFRFDGMTDEEIDSRIRAVKDRHIHTFWGYLPENARKILSKYYPAPNEDDVDAEANMAILPHEKLEYHQPKSPVEVKRVNTPGEFRIWSDITNRILHDGYGIIHPENHYHLCKDEKMVCYLGYNNSIPVSTSAIMYNGTYASLEFVTTLVSYRRKGIGRAVCSTAIEEAFRTGVDIITLRSFGISKVLYSSLGFKEY